MEHKEAIEIVKKNYPHVGFSGSQFETALRVLVPELAESEDERIRKLLVWQVHRNIEDETNDLAQSVYDGIKGHDPDLEESIEDWKRCLAYLEKQKERKPVERNEEDEKIRQALIRFFKNTHDWVNLKYDGDEIVAYLERQKEQKPAEVNVKALLAADRLASAEMTGRLKERSEIMDNPEKYGLQKPADWSEEADYRIRWIISLLTTMQEKGIDDRFGDSVPDDIPDMIAWLKSLYERFNLQAKREWNEEEVPDETKQECGSIDVLRSIKTSHIETLKNLLFYFKGERKSTREEINTSFIPCLEYLLKDTENTNDRTEWSEEDERLLNIIIDILDREEHNGHLMRDDLKACVKLLKSLRSQPKQEWSEEDKINLNGCICSLHQYGYMTYADFLKHLPERFRPQPHWKPSEEQMEWLESAVKLSTDKPHIHGIIISLYEQLKRL